MYGTLKKKYGQNFLIDKNIQKKIVSLIPKNNSNIIEIGPGDGRLTECIIKTQPNELLLIEIDTDLIPLLNSKFLRYKNIKIINQDILDYDFNEKIDLIISNLPYNISSQILLKICLNNFTKKFNINVSKEFAFRLIDKKLNSLNSIVNCFYDISDKFNVSKNSFRPIPKIDSTVLLFTRKENVLLKKNEIYGFIKFKRGLFSHKRKTLKNLLREHHFLNNKFDLNKRVENLSLEELLEIFRLINL